MIPKSKSRKASVRLERTSRPQWDSESDLPRVLVYCGAESHGKWWIASLRASVLNHAEVGLDDGEEYSLHFRPESHFEAGGEWWHDRSRDTNTSRTKVQQQRTALDANNEPTFSVLTDEVARVRWNLECPRCGLAVRTKDDRMIRILATLLTGGVTEIDLSNLGAIVRSTAIS